MCFALPCRYDGSLGIIVGIAAMKEVVLQAAQLAGADLASSMQPGGPVPAGKPAGMCAHAFVSLQGYRTYTVQKSAYQLCHASLHRRLHWAAPSLPHSALTPSKLSCPRSSLMQP